MTIRIAARAGVWSALDLTLRQVVNFLVIVIMARLLRPADFGIVALVTFFANVSIVFVQGGLSQALVQRQQTSADEESAVFWWNMGGALVCALLLAAIAPAIARTFGYPLLRPLMLMGAAQVILTGLGAVQIALLSRALRFDLLTIAGVVSSLLSGAGGIAAALYGLGPWALAFQLAAQAGLNSALMWVLSAWRPRFHFRFSTIRSLLGFGIFLSLSSALEVMYTQGFALIIGKLHGVRDVGLYNRAASTQALPSSVISVMVSRTALPLFSARAGDKDSLRRGVRLANMSAMILNLPAMLGLSVLSDLVMVALFGSQWVSAAPILSILALGGVFLPVHAINLQVLLAEARSRRFFTLEVIKKAGGIVFVIAGSWFGIRGLAWSSVAFGLVALPINTHPVKQSLGYGVGRQLWDLAGLVVPAAAMVLVLSLLKPVLPFAPWLKLLLLTGLGAAIYAGLGLALRIGVFIEAKDIALSIVRREAPSAA
jgi:O-antigen/teichoic acid export membrane protein